MEIKAKLSERSQSEFNPYRCGNCSRAVSNLKLCSGCCLISYCSVDCQRKYLKIHRPLCRVINKILTSNKKSSIHEIAGLEFVNTTGAEKLSKASFSLMMELPELLERNLTFEERLLIMYPKYCEVCYNTDSKQLIRCSNCKFAAFCKTGDCQAKSEANPNIHQVFCAAKKIAFLTHRAYKYDKIFTQIPKPLDFTEFLENNIGNCDLFTLIEHITGKKFIKNPSNREEMHSCATVCQFNYTATIIYALEKVKLLQSDKESLNIHIVGAKHEFDLFTKDTYGLFFVFLPKLTSLKIAFIGPEFISTGSQSEEIDFFGRTIHAEYFSMFYEDCPNPKPDFIMCFNSGFTDETWEDVRYPTDWVRGMKQILRHRIPFAFTTFMKTEIFEDARFVKKVAELLGVYKDLTGVKLGDNPFLDLRGFLNADLSSDEPLLYGNQKICVMNWKESLGPEFNRYKSEFERQLK